MVIPDRWYGMFALKSLGAEAVVVFDPTQHSAEDLANEVQRVTGKRGVRFAIDPVGGATGSAVVKCLAPGGRSKKS